MVGTVATGSKAEEAGSLKDAFDEKVRAACELFVAEQNTKTAEAANTELSKSVKVGDIPIILRTLGFAPSEERLKAFIAQTRGVELSSSQQTEDEESEDEEDDPNEELVDYNTLVRSVLSVTAAPENSFAFMEENDERLQRAFEALDIEGVGYVEVEKLREVLTTQGEAMSVKEVEEMMKCGCADEEAGRFYYEDYIYMVTKATPIV